MTEVVMGVQAVLISICLFTLAYASTMLRPEDLPKSRALKPNDVFIKLNSQFSAVAPPVPTPEGYRYAPPAPAPNGEYLPPQNDEYLPPPKDAYLPPKKPLTKPTSTPTPKSQVLLGEPCEKTSDCQPELSECHPEHRICTCRAYSVEANTTTCLPGTLLGFRCETDPQCAVKVPSSGCVNGICACGDGYVAYRRHTCLTPSKQGDVCFENEQCTLADRGSFCKFVVPKVYGRCQCQAGKVLGADNRCTSFDTKIGDPCEEESDCPIANAFCQKKLDGNSVCTCDVAFAPSADMRRCLATYRGFLPPTSLGYPCNAHLQCQLADPNSICHEGICDCAASTKTKLKSESKCNAKNTGCYNDTFQCHADGKCISWYFVCDGKVDCSDSSDENCDSEGECPPQAFQCGQPSNTQKWRAVRTANDTGFPDYDTNLNHLTPEKAICISRSKICDGVLDCSDGSDEVGCKVENERRCPQGTFQCETTKECLPEQHFCNAIPDCKDWSDENALKCRVEFQPADYCPFRCKNGLCRSSAILCSNVDGCGDNSDETSCSVCRCPRVPGLSQPQPTQQSSGLE